MKRCKMLRLNIKNRLNFQTVFLFINDSAGARTCFYKILFISLLYYMFMYWYIIWLLIECVVSFYCHFCFLDSSISIYNFYNVV